MPNVITEELKREYLFVKKIIRLVEEYPEFGISIEILNSPDRSEVSKEICRKQIKEYWEKKRITVEYDDSEHFGNFLDIVFRKLVENPSMLEEFGVKFDNGAIIVVFIYVLGTKGLVINGNYRSYLEHFEDLFVALKCNELKTSKYRIPIFLEEKDTDWKIFAKELPLLLDRARRELKMIKEVVGYMGYNERNNARNIVDESTKKSF